MPANPAAPLLRRVDIFYRLQAVRYRPWETWSDCPAHSKWVMAQPPAGALQPSADSGASGSGGQFPGRVWTSSV
ncbi:uncharacterized protein UV8b_05954 [Ustilaginoidea virens]|uniref:Uncharacterized protein n=1 Tax=Ustilaginoidea virens TaxID=1159556 RepID=A0A8E5MJE6_USTVR|nr:uncharacterized protein UV8b_05954 [Ustilaginoidea virens]QUC21711.1 hypothetical protein UV8b_05954 [Ustilaginoidea virens]